MSQILFGSDWPFTPEAGVARNIHLLVNGSDLSESDARAIARENAERIFPRLAALARSAAREEQARRFDLGAALIQWIQKAEPVGSGGLYPEPEVEFAGACPQVWYLRWPELDQRMRGRARVAGQPFDLGWGLPPAGTLARHTTPFLTFSRGEDGGLRLTGISREFLQALWLLEGGRCWR